MAKKLRCAFLLSGGGTTFENMMENIRDGKVDAEIAVVVSSKEGAYGLERAAKWGVPAEVVPRKKYTDTERFSADVTAVLEKYGELDLILMGGWLCLYRIPEKFRNRVLNVHPALIPAFSGKGMYGEHVHKAVLERGAKVTGCTIHFVDNIYDHGPILIQSAVKVEDDDTTDTLTERVQAEERRIFPRAVQLVAEGKVEITDNRTKIKK